MTGKMEVEMEIRGLPYHHGFFICHINWPFSNQYLPRTAMFQAEQFHRIVEFYSYIQFG